MKHRIVLLGPPASGKGTQAELITARYGIPVTSSGAVLREEKRRGTPLGLEADKLTSQGKLVPDEIVIELMSHWLERHGDAWIFDGFPRSVPQAEALERLLAQQGTPLDVVLALQADLATLQQRVTSRLVCSQCGLIVSAGLHVASVDAPCPRCGGALTRRNDDTLETLSERMREYAEKTEPLVEYYEQRGLLRTIDSAGVPDAVFQQVAAILES